MDAVVAELERRDAGPFLFARLELDQVLVGIAGDSTQLVEFVVIACRNDAAVADQHGRIIDDGKLEQAAFVAMFARLFIQRGEER